MKVNELFEAYEAPVKNKKLGFRERTASGAGIPVGGTKEWLATIKATPTDVEQAHRVIRQSPEFKALLKLADDVTTSAHSKRGSMMFIAHSKFANGNRIGTRRFKFTVQPNGKIDETSPNDYHRAPVNGKKPRIVPGDAVNSIAKSMIASIEVITKVLERRFKEHAAGLKKAGLNEAVQLDEAPRGPDWTVQFSYTDKDGKSKASGSFVVKDYVGKDRAKAAAEKYLAKKYDGKDPQITRITQVPFEKA